MAEQNQSPPPQGFAPAPVFYQMVPVPMAQLPKPPDKPKENSAWGFASALLWAVMLLLAFWFITGGYQNLQ